MSKDLEGKSGEVDPAAKEPTSADAPDCHNSAMELDENIVQKGSVVFFGKDGEVSSEVPIELKVDLSCCGDKIITAIACIVPENGFKKLDGRVAKTLCKYFLEVGINCDRATVLNAIVERFYEWLRYNSAKFEIEGGYAIGFEEVAAKHADDTLKFTEDTLPPAQPEGS